MDYSNPLTTELFDRTEQQRSERAKIVAQLYRDGAEPATVEARANKEMMDCFLGDVALAVKDRTREKIKTTLQVGPCVDREAVELSVHAEVVREIAELHETLPFPNLDRLVAGGIS